MSQTSAFFINIIIFVVVSGFLYLYMTEKRGMGAGALYLAFGCGVFTFNLMPFLVDGGVVSYQSNEKVGFFDFLKLTGFIFLFMLWLSVLYRDKP